MRAIVVNEFGGPEELELVEKPIPIPRPGQALITVQAIGVGLADCLLRRGFLSTVELGFTPGLEMAGTVAEVGEGVDTSWLNSRVFATVPEGAKSGCYAEFVAVDVDQLVPVSPAISAAQAVSLGINAAAAEFMIRRSQLEASDQVIVRGASGGIGLMLVQLAARRGATVTASTSSNERAEHLLKLGASHAVDRTCQPLSGAAPDRYDVVLDTVAGADVRIFSDKLRNNGRVVFGGIAGGPPQEDLAAALFDQRSLSFSMLSLDSIDKADRRSTLSEIFELAARDEVSPIIHETLDLAKAPQAHSNLEAGNAFGKIVLTVGATA